MVMADMPKRLDEGESTLLNGAPPRWENVATPVIRGGAPAQLCQLPASAVPPPSAVPLGQAGYRPVYDGGAGVGAPLAGSGYAQNNYGQPNMAEVLAMAALMPRRRRIGRHVVFWMMLCFAIIAAVLLHGCASFFRLL
jgi:hypothetical protein